MENPAKVLWRPNPGRQTAFVSTAAHECLWGGEAGGGKSRALVALPLRWCHHPRFRALILRREASDLGKLLENADRLYPFAFPGARVNRQSHVWTFPSGATVRFNHCQHEADKYAYQGDEFNLVGWDELTHFTEGQYTEVNTRLRTTEPDLPCISRATANPGGTGHEWVLRRFAAWIDPDAQVEGLARRTAPDGRALPAAREGQVLWFVRAGETGERVVPEGTPAAKSRVFYRSVRSECVQLDPSYNATLDAIPDPVRRAQLKSGDWLKRASPKEYWDRKRVTHVDAVPRDVAKRARFWDLAATVKGDWTVGGRMSITPQGVIVIEHVLRFRGPPERVHSEFGRVAPEDKALDEACAQWIPQDPGQAGKDQVRTYQVENPGITVRARRPTGDKLVRFGPASARAAAGTLVVVRGSWNEALHDELEAIPQQAYDDQMDVVSDGVAVLTGAVRYDDDEQQVSRAGRRR